MIKKKETLFFCFLTGVVLILVFLNWVNFNGLLSSGDSDFFYSDFFLDLPLLPQVWNGSWGIGSLKVFLNFFPYYEFLPNFFSRLGLGWLLVERFSWYYPFLLLSLSSSFLLLKVLKIKSPFLFIGSLFYLLNSYVLMIIGGGQISIALGYALFPLVSVLTIVAFEKSNLVWLILTGLIFSLQLSFEPRLFLLNLFVCLLYLFLNCKFKLKRLFVSFVSPLVLTGLIHVFWLLPFLLVRRQPFDSFLINLTKSDWLSFLSLADFSDSLSLLHPNWPENIFGKTYFFNPLFLVLPLIAFSSLLFINFKRENKEARRVLSFVFIGFLGVFLAKGVNPPFGFVYRFLYDNIPFFNTFRDPVKFYFFIALSYAFLIPFSLQKIYFFLNRVSRKIAILFVFGFVLIFLVLIKPAWTGKLGGTFKTREIPLEYLQLKEFLLDQDDFFRTLWLPKRHRFGFYSNNHPAIDSENSFGPNYCLTDICSSEKIINETWGKECPINDRCYVKELAFLLDSKTEAFLQMLGIKYLIAPSDLEGEIFITEYKHNPQQRQEVEEFLNQIDWLEKVNVVDKIAVYQVSEFKDHFFIEEESEVEIDWRQISPTKYKVNISGTEKPFRLVFSEKFDPLWQAKINEQTIDSQEYKGILNSFWIEKESNLNLTIEFAPQKYVYLGGIVSLIVLTGSVGYLIYAFGRKKN